MLGFVALDNRWDRAVPDLPRWVEVRSMLLHGRATTVGDHQGGVVVDEGRSVGGVVGTPDAGVIREALAILKQDSELLVIPEQLGLVTSLLARGRARRAVLHALRAPLPGPGDPDIEVWDVDEDFLRSLPPELAEEADGAYIAAVRRVDGLAVSMCAASMVTETLWDIGIDTLEGYRRQGHARQCVLGLASVMSARGLEPVWGAYEDNLASLGMASSLGFEPVDELWVVELGN